MNAAIPTRNPELVTLCRQYHVRTLSLFGSAARDEANAASDLDLLIEFEVGRSRGP